MATIADILQEQGRRQGEYRRRQGEQSAMLFQNLAGIVGQTAQSIAKEQQEAPIRAQEQRIRDLKVAEAERADLDDRRARGMASAMETALSRSLTKDPATGVTTYDRNKLLENMAEVGVPQTELARYMPILDAADAAVTKAKQLHVEALKHSAQLVDMAGNDPTIFRSEIQRGITNGLFTQDEAQPYLDAADKDPTHIGRITGALLGRDPNAGQFTLNPGDRRFDANGNEIANVPEPVKPPQMREVVVRGPNGRPVKKLVSEAEMMQGVEQYQEPKSDNEPLVAILGPDGKSVYVPRSQAIGKQPANAREQGRPVVSGDANKLADFDTSISDLGVLKQAITDTGNATGTSAAIGAGVPAWVTDLTGWGTDAKKRQGVIDRVKQVIGKTLEGGVLRKEDEYKYEKILPTIKDAPAVAAAKLAGLEQAITQRRQTTLDALGDAGYDVSRFQARTPKQAEIVVTAPDGSTHRFATQAEADTFKKLAGIK